MNKKLRTKAILVFAMSLVILGCGPAGLLGQTLSPVPPTAVPVGPTAALVPPTETTGAVATLVPPTETTGAAATPVPPAGSQPTVGVSSGGGQATPAPQGTVAAGAGLNLPAGPQFTVAVGDAVSNGKPGPGAGNIEQAGLQEIYVFTANPEQTVYFQVTQPNNVGNMMWQLVDSSGTQLFNTCLQCSDLGDQTLDKGGTYALIVGNGPGGESATGTYGFKLWDVPAPQQFNIKIGDTVSNGQPGPGAGNIESPGAKDIFIFTASAGQTVAFHVTQAPHSGNILWQLLDETGTKLFDTCLECSDPDTQTLDHGDQYQIIVGNDTEASLGAYGFQISSAP